MLIATLALSCGQAAATPELTPARPIGAPVELATASPTPSFSPGPQFTSGRVIARTAIGVVIESVERREEIDLRSVLEVWRETPVPATAIEIDDDLSVSGSRGPAVFGARYVWANIGRMDGVIRAIDATGVTVSYLRPGSTHNERRIELSPYLEIVSPATLSDLVVGASIGMVLYRARAGASRATRIWIGP